MIQQGRFIYLQNPSPHLVRNLKTEFSYMKKSARFMANPEWGRVKLYNEKFNKFPVGLLPRYKQIAGILDKPDYQKIKVLGASALGLRLYQIDAVNAIQTHDFGIIQIPTGGGKTNVAIAAINEVFKDKKILVIVPTIDLKIQWEKENSRIVVRTYQSIKNRIFLQSFDVIFMDECHHAAAKTIFKIGMNIRQDAKIYGLSATPFMREEDNLKVEAVLGPVIYSISAQELIDLGYLVKPSIYFIELPAPKEKFYLTYKDAYEDLVQNNVLRNLEIVKRSIAADLRVLVLVSRIEHGELLYQYMKQRFIDVVFLSGEHTKLERTDTDHRVIIATSIYDEGVNIPQLNVLIMAAGGKSDIKTLQRVGRLLRPAPNKSEAIIYDFVDIGKFVYVHSKARMKLLSKVFGNEVKLLPPL